jgi:hypothetical protein
VKHLGDKQHETQAQQMEEKIAPRVDYPQKIES